MSENSNREVERKYLLGLSYDSFNEFIEGNQKELKQVTKKCGIVQWYMDGSLNKNEEERVRLEIFKEKTGFRHVWTRTIKIKDEKIENRKEYEKTLKPKKKSQNENDKDYVDLDELKDKKFVLKIRHFLNNVDGVKECVVDEFLNEKHKMNTSEKYLMEIELDEKAKDLSEEERNKIYKNQLEKINNKEINDFNEITRR